MRLHDANKRKKTNLLKSKRKAVEKIEVITSAEAVMKKVLKKHNAINPLDEINS